MKDGNVVAKAKEDRFKERYGISHFEAEALFQNSPALETLLRHMYYESMDALRSENDFPVGIARIQGETQVLWDLLQIPQILDDIRNTE